MGVTLGIGLAGCQAAPSQHTAATKGSAPLTAQVEDADPAKATTQAETQAVLQEPAAQPIELPPEPILDADIRAARLAAQSRQLRSKESPLPDLQCLVDAPALPPDEASEDAAPVLPGYFVPLAFPATGQTQPLAKFEAALEALEAGQRSEPVRVAIYGASGVAADRWTGYVRAYLQARFGDGGPGIVPAAAPHRWSRHQELAFTRSKNWTKHNAFRLGDAAETDYFGIMGQAMSAEAEGAWTELEPHSSSPSARELAFYELHYLIQPEGGAIELSLDGEPLEELSTAGEQAQLGRHRVKLRPGRAHALRVELRGDGPVRLLGLVAETGKPGVIVDSLGVNGAKTEDQRRWDEQLWAAHLATRAPELYVLAYGNNEAVDEDVPLSDYERGYVEVLERFQTQLPEASCVMIGPSDFPIVEQGEVRPRPRLAKIREVQASLAPAFGCAFLDARAIIGGEGAIAQWVEAGLAKEDHLHLERPGYLRFGMAVGDALMQHYDWRALSQIPS